MRAGKIEVDIKGDNNWTLLQMLTVQPQKAINLEFNANQKGEWIRVTSDITTNLTFHLSYTALSRFISKISPDFNGIETVGSNNYKAGLLYSLGDNRRALGFLSGEISDNAFKENGYYELNAEMQLEKKDNPETANLIREKLSLPKNNLTIEESSVLIVDDKNRRWRLPLGKIDFTALTNRSLTRVCKEVATERDLMNLDGTFYELPAENADGFAKIRPVSSHDLAIYDYASYRGMLILSGIK